MKKPLAIALCLAGIFSGTAPAYASSPGFGDREVRVMTVDARDLDLQKPDGQQELQQRLNKAVRHVCRMVDVETGFRKMDRDARVCMAKARAGAYRQMAALIEDERRGG